MQKVKLKLENCYGIKKLETEFDFTDNKAFAVYAPNGVMKTSFAKTFVDHTKGLDSKDLIFPDKVTVREIKKDAGIDLGKDEVFVVEPYNEDFTSTKMSTLLVNSELKKRYDDIHLKIDEKKENLLKEIKINSGVKNTIENEISNTFTREDDRLYDSLIRIEKEVIDTSEPQFADIKYIEVFNEKVIGFLTTKDFKSKLEEYIKKYDQLISASKYFRKGVFNHNNASVIAKNLKDNGFFAAQHSVTLNSKNEKSEIRSLQELEQVIEAEKNSILNNEELVKAFEELDSKLKANQELRNFREYLMSNIKILPELKNPDSFRQKLWVSYFKAHKELFKEFLGEYNIGKKELDQIGDSAKGEITQWIKVIDIFNKRFFVPFKLTIKNQVDVMLKNDVPSISFVFKDNDREAAVKKDDLLQALSSGERRALYILNIIFEVQARKQEGQETLFIVDDIADSFDYKNKYAIIEYLKDISDGSVFKLIILTHNFDFFRTVQSRFISYRNCLMVEKTPNEIKIVPAANIKNPFKYLMDHLDDDGKLIASIPFARNIIEYTKGNADSGYLLLTSLLHIKSNSTAIVKEDLKKIYTSIFPSLTITFTNPTEPLIGLILRLADGCLTMSEGINLENKIILSIAIRLKTEQFILSKISDKSEPTGNQTRILFERYKNEFGSDSAQEEKIKLLDQVNLMTPENIHLNSFMYEPILDMSDTHLKSLYTEISALA